MKRPCTRLRSSRPAIAPWRRVQSGTPTAHERVALPLLPSGPGGVRRFSLRGAQPSTRSREAHSTRTTLEREFNPARADCGLQGTATSPSSTATLHYIRFEQHLSPERQAGGSLCDAAPTTECEWRRGGDLNPRYAFGVLTISSRAS